MLLELAIADASGVGFEYVSDDIVDQFNTGYSYRQHPIHTGLHPGDYSDDTQMSLAVAEYILENGPKQNQLMFAQKVLDCFKRNPIVGYSRGFQVILEEVSTAKELIQRINPDSDKNGGAMRAIPCCVLDTPEAVAAFAGWQASFTHSGRGVIAAQAAALAAWFCRRKRGSLLHLPNFLNNCLKMNESWEWYDKVKVPSDLGMVTVKAAITAVMTTSSLHDCLVQSIAFKGDVDTVAAIALGIASQSEHHEKNLPDSLLFGLRNNEYGKDYIVELDKKLELF